MLKKRLKAADCLARDDLRRQCGVEDDDLPPDSENAHRSGMELEDVLCLAMQGLYKLAIRPTSFKVSYNLSYLLTRGFTVL